MQLPLAMLAEPLVDQQIADRLFDKGADFLFSRRDHRGQWYSVRQLKQLFPHTRTISVWIVRHRLFLYNVLR